MRVLQIVHTSMQFEPPIVALGTLLAKRGHRLLCSGYWLPGLQFCETVAPDYRIARIDRGDYSGLPRFVRGGLRLLRFWWAVTRLSRQFRPEVVLVYSYEMLPLAWALSKTGRAPLIYYCVEYSSTPGWRQYAIGWGILKTFERWFVRRCAYVLSVEENRARLQERDWGRVVDAIILNSPPSDVEFEKAAEQAIERRPSRRSVRCVYAGRIATYNCVEALLSCAARLGNASIDLFGPVDASFAEQWRSLLSASAAVAAGRVRYCGSLPYDDLKYALLGYDVGLVLYDDQLDNTRLASPSKVFEYMRAGLTVITTAQPTPASVVQDAGCGFVVRPPNLHGLEDALNTLARDPARVISLRRNALSAFRRQYAYDQAVAPLIQFLEGRGAEAPI